MHQFLFHVPICILLGKLNLSHTQFFLHHGLTAQKSRIASANLYFLKVSIFRFRFTFNIKLLTIMYTKYTQKKNNCEIPYVSLLIGKDNKSVQITRHP